MRYILTNKEYKKINEAWFDDKLKTLSDALKSVFTAYLKSFTKVFPVLYNTEKILSGEDIKLYLEEGIKSGIDALIKEIPKCNLPEELDPDLWDYLNQFNVNIKNSILKELNDKFAENNNLNSYKSVISDIFNKFNVISQSLRKDYIDSIKKVDSMKEKEKVASDKIDNLFKVFKSDIDDEDYNEIFDNKEYNGEFAPNDIIEYKMDGWDESKKKEQQQDSIGKAKIKSIKGDILNVIDELTNKEIQLDIEKVIGKEDVKVSQDKLKTELGKIKEDEFKMGKVLSFVQKLNQQ